MMKVGGIWCSPTEIESALIEHPDVLEVAVVGREDADGLIKPEAWIVCRTPETPAGLDTNLVHYCKTRLAPYKYPRWCGSFRIYRRRQPARSSGSCCARARHR
jgi:acyl-coenzyme A synthetase/AMP-(fatty) acid ligase